MTKKQAHTKKTEGDKPSAPARLFFFPALAKGVKARTMEEAIKKAGDNQKEEDKDVSRT